MKLSGFLKHKRFDLVIDAHSPVCGIRNREHQTCCETGSEYMRFASEASEKSSDSGVRPGYRAGVEFISRLRKYYPYHRKQESA